MMDYSYSGIKRYIEKTLVKYMNFAKIETFPEIHYEIMDEPVKFDDNTVYAQNRNVYTCKGEFQQWLMVLPDILDGDKDYILYHELTHILDVREFKSDFINRKYNGYTGYHAGHIDLLKLVGAPNVNEPKKFELKTKINFIVKGQLITLPVEDYILESYNHARDAFRNGEFTSIEKIKVAVELLFNFWGRKVICQTYSDDRNALIYRLPMEPFDSFCEEKSAEKWEDFLKGAKSDSQIRKINDQCTEIINNIIKKNNLQNQSIKEKASQNEESKKKKMKTGVIHKMSKKENHLN